MRLLLLAGVLAVAAGLARAEEKGAAAAPKVEGKWVIAYAEEGGRRNNTWETQVATLSDGTLSFERDGKKSTLKLNFGPHQTVKGTLALEGEDKGGYAGVYIASQGYLCLSLNPAGKAGGEGGAAAARD